VKACARLSRVNEIVDDRRVGRHPASPWQDDIDAALALSDVSVFGCQIGGEPARTVKPGQFVEVNFGGRLTIKGVARWQRGAHVGMEFILPISADMVEGLVTTTQLIQLRVL
jgi:hypothetical protein